MTIRYINLTPHALYVKDMSGEYITILPDAEGPARVIYDRLPPEQVRIGGSEVAVAVAGPVREIVGLPEPQPDIVFIVAKAVADAAPRHRGDLMSPGRLLRDAEGKVVGCDGLTRRA